MSRRPQQINQPVGCRLSGRTRRLLARCRRRQAALAEAASPRRSPSVPTVDDVLRAALRNYDHTLGRRLRLAGIDDADSPESTNDGHRGPPIRLPSPRID